jgi:L-aminopeptidase/D-esterase-like protein
VFVLMAGTASLTWAQVPGPHNAITDVPGIRVGHYTSASLTGTTVVLAENNGQGVPGSVTQRGGSPGTRETDLLKPENMVDRINAVALTGGGPFGLAAASGVMQCLEEDRTGFPVGGGNVVPIVPTAVLFDGAQCETPSGARPDFSFGYQACRLAQGGPVAQGNVGAGAGAVSGGIKGGLGTASVVLDNGVVVGAIVAVGSSGSAFDRQGDLYAASLRLGDEFEDLLSGKGAKGGKMPLPVISTGVLQSGTNAVIATNLQLTKAQAIKLAEMADDGLARALRPTHSPHDSDTVFALGTGRIAMAALGDAAAVLHQVGAAAADALSRAVVHALVRAESTPCHQSYCDRYPKACAKKAKK